MGYSRVKPQMALVMPGDAAYAYYPKYVDVSWQWDENYASQLFGQGSYVLANYLLQKTGVKLFRDVITPGTYELPKVGPDYRIRIPSMDQFIPYPRVGTSYVPDVTKGPLVYDPTTQTYRNKDKTVTYNPDQVTWQVPKIKAKVDPVTGEKTVGFENTKTGEIENIANPDVTSGATTGIGDIVTSISRFFDLTRPIDINPLKNVPITTAFPFSLPWDLSRAINIFVVPPQRPKFEIEMNIAGKIVKKELEIPEYVYDYVPLIRSAILLMFGIGLIFATRKLFGGAK
ncbi:hypothetical protein D3C71_1330300 [compost metagenome]